MPLAIPMLLENDIGKRHAFPDELMIGHAYLHFVDDPAFDPIWKGDGVLGWEGDPRLAVYMCITRGTWELVRYEANGTYTSSSRISAGTYLAPQMVGMWIGWLLGHDGRRGYDPVVETDEHYERQEAEADKAWTEKLALDVEDRLRHALHKDGVDEVWGGQWGQVGTTFPEVGPTSQIAQAPVETGEK